MDLESGNRATASTTTTTATRSQRTGLTKCLCQFISIIKYFPFVMITALYLWGVCVYFYYVLGIGYQSLWAKIVVGIVFVPLYILSYSSYIATIFTDHRPVPCEYELPDSINVDSLTEEELNQILENVIHSRNLQIYTRSFGGYVRFCRKCHILKPDRCHHCSVCDQCIRKMDHHCHWVSNCVAYENYKYFIQFLSYTVVLALYTSFSSIELFQRFWKEENYPGKFQVFFLVVFCFIFSLSILFLLSYHIYLVIKNSTTLEAYQVPRFKNFEYDKFRFNLGAGRNFREVFGDNKLYWFIPMPNHSDEGDGLYFKLPLNPAQFGKSNSLSCSNSIMQQDGAAVSSNPIVIQSHHNHQTFNATEI